MRYAQCCQADEGHTALREGIRPLSTNISTLERSTSPQRLSEGVCWFLIAITILLAVLDTRLSARSSASLAPGWAGVFVLYYVLRSWFMLHGQRSTPLHRHHISQHRWWFHVPVFQLFDLLVITILVALSGGWASPLYLLYLGWAITLIDVPSPRLCLFLAGLAGAAFMMASLLAPHLPFSSLYFTMIVERLLLLLLLAVGIGGIKASLERARSLWEAECHQWSVLRQAMPAYLSHELYTPLSVIRVGAALLAATESEIATERQQSLLHVIERNCTRMNLLIDDLIALWQEYNQQLDYTPVRLHCLKVVESVEQMLGPLLDERQQRLVIVAEPPDVCVLADARRLEQVLVNLLANAQKYASAGTPITVTISGRQNKVVFAVHDEGAGMPLEEQSHLFELFYRGANHVDVAHGAGIGLALAKAQVVLMGGHIWVESWPGKGSTFYFSLPADMEEANAHLAG